MNPKTLQYPMGHSEIGVTMNMYTHLGLEDSLEEVRWMQELENDRKEQEKLAASICRVLPSDEFHFGKRGTELIRWKPRKTRHPAA